MKTILGSILLLFLLKFLRQKVSPGSLKKWMLSTE
jgi:hypothetical protein